MKITKFVKKKYTKPTHQSECLGHEKVLSGSKFPEETSKGISKNKQRCHKQLSQVRQDSFFSQCVYA